MPDYAGKTFDFIEKSELKPVRQQIEQIIRKLQEKLRDEGITFDPKLVGSGGKHLVTRVVKGNTGFDFDYNFVIHKDSDLKPKKLRELIIGRLEEVVKNTSYSHVSNGKQSISIKFVDKKKSKIIHSCDFAIINEYINDYDDLYQEILIRDKQRNSYSWNKRPCGKNYGKKLSNLKANGLWMELKTEYLKLKNKNKDKEKKSFSLFYEAINNVYNRYDWV